MSAADFRSHFFLKAKECVCVCVFVFLTRGLLLVLLPPLLCYKRFLVVTRNATGKVSVWETDEQTTAPGPKLEQAA